MNWCIRQDSHLQTLRSKRRMILISPRMQSEGRSEKCEVRSNTFDQSARTSYFLLRTSKVGPTERLALSWGKNARQFTKLLLSLLSHVGFFEIGLPGRSSHRARLSPPAHCVLRRGSLALAARRAKAGGLPRIRTVFSPGKSRDFTAKVCSPGGRPQGPRREGGVEPPRPGL